MTTSLKLSFLATAMATLFLTGCGDAETIIIEREPVEAPADDHDHDHDHGGDYIITSEGRLVVTEFGSNAASVFDLDDKSLLDSFTLTYEGASIYPSGGNRYAVVVSRANDFVGFIDGGLYREDHVDHMHDYAEAPAIADLTLNGNLPTHVVSYGGLLAIFNDGNTAASTTASVEVLSDLDISNNISDIPTLTYTNAMHGAAQPRGEYLISTIRRDDAESTSTSKTLPDQVGVFHLHDGEYEQDMVFDMACPNLHGSAQNAEYVAFGCSDGVMLIHEHDGSYEAEKLMNSAEVATGGRIGTLYGNSHVEQLIGLASARATNTFQFFAIDGHEGEMELIDWEPAEGARPLSSGFAYHGDYFIILDSLGHVTVLEPHLHAGHTHWEVKGKVAVTQADVSAMPEGQNFALTFSQNGHYVFVSDPMAQHVLKIDLDMVAVEDDIELDFVPGAMTWVGIPGEDH